LGPRSRRLAAALAALAATLACSDVRLEYPPQDVDTVRVDDEITITGEYCTSPASDVSFPVKVMFIVDGSGSQQFSDQNRQRVVAVEETINRLLGSANTYFKVIVFNASVTATPPPTGDPPPPVFTNDIARLLPALDNLAEADTLTDYQGALALAHRELLRDMTDVASDAARGRAELGRTKYVVVFISDGLPDPQCEVGLGNDLDPNFPGGVNRLCEDSDFLSCLLAAPGTECGFGDGNPCDASCGGDVCSFNGTACFRSPEAATLFGGASDTELSAGSDYNQPYQILQKIQDIIDLQERFEVGEIRLHAGLVLDPLADPAVIAIFGDASQAAPLMQQAASIGQGRFLQFYGGDSIDFLDIDFDSIKKPRVIRGFFADNEAARWIATGLQPDTDFDGLVDDDEFAAGSDALVADTDGDGHGDFIEWERRAHLLDATDPCLPRIIDVPGADPDAPCDPGAPVNCEFEIVTDPTGAPRRRYLDTDRDGLNDCEERHLGTDPRRIDTDADGLPDRIDFVAGLSPLTSDFDRDADQDTVPNGREIEWHLHPRVSQSDEQMRIRYRYDRPETGRTLDGRPCYRFEVRRVKLAATQVSQDLTVRALGVNEVRLYILENLSDDLSGPPVVRTACVRTRYVPPSLKVPARGRVDLTEADFRYLPGEDPLFNDVAVLQNLFDRDQHCMTVTDDDDTGSDNP
jgi:hypothetical protein